MKAQDFCFWLQGLFELANPNSLTAEQTDLIKRHLNLVFVHDIDPKMGPKEHQEQLNAIHSPAPVPFHGGPSSFGERPSLSGAKMRC